MAKVTLSRLTLQNFRSFDGTHTIDFDGTGLYLVRGYNHDSRGESGSGKSSLFHAIAYALDFAPYAATELRTWHNDDPMFVELELGTDKGPAVIHRGDKLWLKYEGKKITSAKAVAEKIDEICGINKKLREAITYRRQRTFGLFLSKTDREKKEFLIELLGLHWLEEAIEAATKKVTECKKAVDAHVPMLELHKKLVAEAKERVIAPNFTDTTRLEQEIDLAVAELREAADIRAAAQADVDAIKYEAFDYDTSLIDRQEHIIQQCQFRISRLGQPELLVQRAQREIFRLHNEISRLFDDKCPRCDRQWDQAQAEMEKNHQEIQRQEVKLKEAEEALTKLKTMREMEATMVKQLDELKLQMQAAERTYLADNRKLSEFKYAKLKEADGDLVVRERGINNLRTRLQALKNGNELNARLHAQANEAVLGAKVKLMTAAADHINLEQLEKREIDFLGMLRGFLGQIFAELLAEVSNETNRILSNLPNASKVTLHFETDRETQDGKLRNEITPVAFFGGRHWPLESGASGGMFTSIELAVDLAVANVISRRTGVELGWLILDESFANGSDKVTKEGCLEILKQYSDDKLIIVVEHASEFKEMFSRVIEVDYRDERSRIR